MLCGNRRDRSRRRVCHGCRQRSVQLSPVGCLQAPNQLLAPLRCWCSLAPRSSSSSPARPTYLCTAILSRKWSCRRSMEPIRRRWTSCPRWVSRCASFSGAEQLRKSSVDSMTKFRCQESTDRRGDSRSFHHRPRDSADQPLYHAKRPLCAIHELAGIPRKLWGSPSCTDRCGCSGYTNRWDTSGCCVLGRQTHSPAPRKGKLCRQLKWSCDLIEDKVGHRITETEVEASSIPTLLPSREFLLDFKLTWIARHHCQLTCSSKSSFEYFPYSTIPPKIKILVPSTTKP